jgi:uncharacterized protein (TIGR03790 family)
MTWLRAPFLILTLALCRPVRGLEPNEVLVVANTDHAASTRLARSYCQRRGIPSGHVVSVSLGSRLRATISRSDYEKRLAHPIRRIFATRADLSHIKCLVTTYGVPYRVARRDPLPGQEEQLARLQTLQQEHKDAMAELEEKGRSASALYRDRQIRLAQVEMDIGRITGVETDAAIDSELSLVLFGAYELYRWQPNVLRTGAPRPFKTLMVSRLDGPSYAIASGLVDKAIAGETRGLTGKAYVDSRGLYAKDLYSVYDQSLRGLASLTRLGTSLAVGGERTAALFPPGSCPEAALYCGWYSLRTYVDAFDFVEGAVGFHIASFEAISIRAPLEKGWCKGLLEHGAAATLGAVAEPYLESFPRPKQFFGLLLTGDYSLVECFAHTTTFTSWMQMLLGDPLYRPFARRPLLKLEDVFKPEEIPKPGAPALLIRTQPAGPIRGQGE